MTTTATDADAPGDEDPQAAVLSLLLQAAGALAKAGDADRACRIAASAWAAVRDTRPDLATKVTTALHGLVKKVDSVAPAGAAGQGAADPDLDVRELRPAQRHEAIFDAYTALEPGAGFVLINDHDPKPLRYQFEAEEAGRFSWDALESGPEVWRVRIGRTAAAPTGAADPDLDVRELRPAQRHEAIFDAYTALEPGAGFVLINDHDPKPLRYQFEAEEAGRFSWDALESGPEVWRVRIGRTANATDAADDTDEEEPDLDVRELAHFKRHDVIFTAYRALRPGRGFVLVNDHDPLPLRYQFEAEHAGRFTWDYLEAGPQVWRVRIGRPTA